MATKIEQLARAALARDTLQLRSLTQDLLRETSHWDQLAPPSNQDSRLLSVAAALAELLAIRQGQKPPTWTKEIGAMPEPFFLVEAATQMRHLRQLCETQSPDPLRKRKLYAPPNFLEFA